MNLRLSRGEQLSSLLLAAFSTTLSDWVNIDRFESDCPRGKHHGIWIASKSKLSKVKPRADFRARSQLSLRLGTPWISGVLWMSVKEVRRKLLKTGLYHNYPKSLIETLVLFKFINKMLFSVFRLLLFQSPLLSFFRELTMLLRDQNRKGET